MTDAASRQCRSHSKGLERPECRFQVRSSPRLQSRNPARPRRRGMHMISRPLNKMSTACAACTACTIVQGAPRGASLIRSVRPSITASTAATPSMYTCLWLELRLGIGLGLGLVPVPGPEIWGRDIGKLLASFSATIRAAMRGHNSGATPRIEPRLETVHEGTSPRTATLADETVRGGGGRVRSGTELWWDLRRG